MERQSSRAYLHSQIFKKYHNYILVETWQLGRLRTKLEKITDLHQYHPKPTREPLSAPREDAAQPTQYSSVECARQVDSTTCMFVAGDCKGAGL